MLPAHTESPIKVLRTLFLCGFPELPVPIKDQFDLLLPVKIYLNMIYFKILKIYFTLKLSFTLKICFTGKGLLLSVSRACSYTLTPQNSALSAEQFWPGTVLPHVWWHQGDGDPKGLGPWPRSQGTQTHGSPPTESLCPFQRDNPEKLAIHKLPNNLTFTSEDIVEFLEIGGWVGSHEMKRHLFLRRKAMINGGSVLKSRDITLPTKVRIFKATVFPVVRYGCESWTIKKAERWRMHAFKLWCRRRVLQVSWTARRSNQSILKKINPEYSLEGLMLRLKLQYFGHLIQKTDSLEKTLMLGKTEGRGRREQQRMRWLAGITDSIDMSLSKP